MVITTHPNVRARNCIVWYFPRLFIACSRLSACWDKPEKVERRLVLVVSFSLKACSIFPSQRTESLEQVEAQSFHNFCTQVQKMKGTVPQGITKWFSLRKQNVQVQEIFECKSQFCHCVFLPPDSLPQNSKWGPSYCLVKCFNFLIHCTDQKTEYTYNGKDIIYINIPQIDLTQDVIKMMCSFIIESMTIVQ